MKNLIVPFIIILLLSSCNAHKEIVENGKPYSKYHGFEPVDPTEYDYKVDIASGGSLINKDIKLLSTDDILQFLNNENVLVSIGQFSIDGSISYIPIVISAKNSSYKVTMDYMKFATLGQKDDKTGDFIGYKRVGIGLRLISLITTTEAGLNIGDLSSIGVGVKSGKIKGTMIIEVIGIKSKEITTTIPLPSEINPTTIQNAVQALATIKSKIYDSDTKLFPQVMAVKVERSKDNVKVGESVVDVKSAYEETKIKLQISNNNADKTTKFSKANNLEHLAFQSLFDKKVEDAIMRFQECEDEYPSFHNSYEIINLLEANKEELQNDKSTKWKEVYKTILDQYSWKLSEDVKRKLSDLSK